MEYFSEGLLLTCTYFISCRLILNPTFKKFHFINIDPMHTTLSYHVSVGVHLGCWKLWHQMQKGKNTISEILSFSKKHKLQNTA